MWRLRQSCQGSLIDTRYIMVYVNLERRTNPDIQSSEILFAWIQECGWNKESYQPQFNQHSTTIEPPFTTMATIEPLSTIKTWTLKR